ncbi:hypothetical protein [Pseudodesulfovibrio portus]|uniref:Uncharacterized protein n=1 Tax=Pseudodesulfovibrio portus TaxID=231439 RepID=A0ABN6RY56_9BACT|nr:hypothetical protein [Pseudodesulfovibrio portus]BDQ34816.1 hypothetical protein JCM14722_23580 [Pseudodesulfovibrio portus]
MAGIVYIAYFVLGIFQLAAVYAGLDQWLGWHFIIQGPLALFLAYTPVVGTIVGFFGAMKGWGWSFIQAGLLFFGSFGLMILFAFFMREKNYG